jgi:hypothetical protein
LRAARVQGSIGPEQVKKDRPQVLFVHAPRDALEMQLLAQQRPERGVVEHRARGMHEPAAGHQREDPLQARAQHADGIRLDHVVYAEFPPYLLDGVDRVPEVGGIGGERDGAHGACRRAGDDLKRRPGAASQLLGDALEHADLIGRACAATRQDQAENRCVWILEVRIHVPGSLARSGRSAECIDRIIQA